MCGELGFLQGGLGCFGRSVCVCVCGVAGASSKTKISRQPANHDG